MQEHAFHLKPSRYYLALWVVVGFMSVIISVLLPFPVWLTCMVVVIVMAYVGYILWKFVLLRHKNSIKRIRHLDDKKWLLQTGDAVFEAELCADSTLTGVVSVLRFRINKMRWPVSCIVFRDSLDGDQYRQLLVVLRTR